MTIEEAALADYFLEIEVSDLCPDPQARRGSPGACARLSTRLRGRRYVASLLTMALLGLSGVPGARAHLPGGLLVTPVSARGAVADLPDLNGDRPAQWPRARPLPGTAGGDAQAVVRGRNVNLR